MAEVQGDPRKERRRIKMQKDNMDNAGTLELSKTQDKILVDV